MASKAQPMLVPREGIEWLEFLPLPALIVNRAGTMVQANSAAVALMVHEKPTWLKHPDVMLAMTNAMMHVRTTHLRGVEHTAIGSLWVGPMGDGYAMLLLDSSSAPATSYTELSATMAAMLAHEIRNPLLSIKGAAQLLHTSATPEDAPLCELIGKEVDRIDQLIATLDPLSITPPKAMVALNVHEPLEHARLAVQAARAGRMRPQVVQQLIRM